MSKTDEDTPADFRQVFDFRRVFETDYRIPCEAPSKAQASAGVKS